jgi:hypothetical protein
MPPSPADRRSLRVRFLVWFSVLVLLVFFGVFQVRINQEYQRLSKLRQDAYEYQYQKTRRAEFTADFAFANAHRGQQPTVRDAELTLNGGQPFPTTQEGSETVLVYTDPNTGGQALLGFKDDKWLDVSAAHPSFASMNLGWIGSVNVARRIAYFIGYIVWPFVFATLLGAFHYEPWRSHKGLAVDLLMLAIVTTILALLGPNPRRALFDWINDDAAAWGMLIIPISAIALGFAIYRSRKPAGAKAPQCKRCGYNLTGNQSGVCPECGATVKAAAA